MDLNSAVNNAIKRMEFYCSQPSSVLDFVSHVCIWYDELDIGMRIVENFHCFISIQIVIADGSSTNWSNISLGRGK